MGVGNVGLIAALLVLGAIIALSIWLLDSLFPEVPNGTGLTHSHFWMRHNARHEPPKREVLKQRYERGEISKAEYDRLSRITSEAPSNQSK